MFGRIDNFITSRNANKIVVALILFLLLLGINNRFIQDDAFISFRYAQNLVEGHGLTWNKGEQKPIEGYTNFLWVIMIALIESLKLDPVFWSMVLSMSFAVGTLFVTYKLALMLFSSRSLALLTVFLLGTNYSFSSYMTGGLETQLHAFFIIVCTYLSYSFLVCNYSRLQEMCVWGGVSMLFSLAMMTRLDSALICIVLYIFVILALFDKKVHFKEKLLSLLFLTIPCLIIVGSWLLFKFVYYDAILPNTFYVKATGFNAYHLVKGLLYIWAFFLDYSFIFIAFLVFLYFKSFFSQPNLLILLIIVGLWFLYIIKIGGDFMEYRLFIPILPFIFLIISNMILLINNSKVQASIIILLVASSFHHAISDEQGHFGIESISSLNAHINDEKQNWKRVGIVLGKLFSESVEPVTIATTASGAISYYSRLRTIDMHGLNDRWIAKNGIVTKRAKPGHTRHATLEYLLKSNVNLILGHPKVKSISTPPTHNPQNFFHIPIDALLLPPTSKIIEIPLNENYKLEVIYLKQHNYIDQTLKRLKLKTYNISI